MRRLGTIILVALLMSFAAGVVRTHLPPSKPTSLHLPTVVTTTTVATETVPWTCQEAMRALDLSQAGTARVWLQQCRDDLVRAGRSTDGVDQAITLLGPG